MRFNSRNFKALVVYLVLFNIALFLSGFRILVWQNNKQLNKTGASENNVISGMAFIEKKPSFKLDCNYFSGLTIFKKVFIYNNESSLKVKNCPLVFRT
jgi:hypothetical protein